MLLSSNDEDAVIAAKRREAQDAVTLVLGGKQQQPNERLIVMLDCETLLRPSWISEHFSVAAVLSVRPFAEQSSALRAPSLTTATNEDTTFYADLHQPAHLRRLFVGQTFPRMGEIDVVFALFPRQQRAWEIGQPTALEWIRLYLCKGGLFVGILPFALPPSSSTSTSEQLTWGVFEAAAEKAGLRLVGRTKLDLTPNDGNGSVFMRFVFMR